MSNDSRRPDERACEGILDGIRVLDFSMFIAGPYCTRLMADMGADVIKVEPPAGDFLRNAPPLVSGRSRYFGHLNCGKRSMTIDLKQPGAIEAVERIASTCDVVVENFRPGVMRRLGLDYDALSKQRPDLIYCSISGYGQTGPRSSYPAYAPIIQAASGYELLQMSYEARLDKPPRNRNAIADFLAATHALAAIQGALFHRERAGVGKHIDVALMDTMHQLMAFEYQSAQNPSSPPAVFRPLTTSDGFVVIAPVSEGNFSALCEAAGMSDLLRDQRFSTREGRMQNWDTLLDLMETWTQTLTSVECEQRLLETGCPAAAYASVSESMATDQVEARGGAVEIRDAGGSYKVPNTPYLYDGGSNRARSWVANLGEHTQAVYEEVGLPDALINTLSRTTSS